ncbi:MAG: NAD-dependent DNA ligase LigA, partial [Chloroflexi bacterium]|nr:NAD-dependent DNA ligase LigA [Chloroflexota bacterium]
KRLAEAWLQMEKEAGPEVPQSLEGLRFVVTGRLEGFGRSEIQEYIKARGGGMSGSVSKKTDYVVVGEEAGSKASDAERLGVAMLSEAEFVALVAEREG